MTTSSFAVPTTDYDNVRVILGSAERSGAWAMPRHYDVRVVLGSISLDLRSALLSPGVSTIDIDVTLGSVEIIVPPELLVELGMVANAASVDAVTGFFPEDIKQPVLRVVGDATLASCEIVRRAA